MQLQKLERVFEEGIGTPSKQTIKDLTAELSQYGPISETNVYNWFQNRRARSKRKQFAEASNNSGPDVEAESESSEKTTRPADISNIRNNTEPIAKDAYIPDPGSNSLDTQQGKGQSSFTSGHSAKLYGSHGQYTVNENAPIVLLYIQSLEKFEMFTWLLFVFSGSS